MRLNNKQGINGICEMRAFRIGLTALILLLVVIGFSHPIYVPAISQARYATSGGVTKELPPEISTGLDVEMSFLKRQEREVSTSAMLAVHINEAYAGKDTQLSEVKAILSKAGVQEWLKDHPEEFKSAKETGKARQHWWPFSLGILLYADRKDTKIWNNIMTHNVNAANIMDGSYSFGEQYTLIPDGVSVLDILLLFASIVAIEEIIIIPLICRGMNKSTEKKER